MELNVWTNATVMSVIPGTKGKKWSVLVQRADGRERTFEVNHVVFALGFGSGVGRIPDIPGQVRSIHEYKALKSKQTAHIGRVQRTDIAFQ
jgi:cation diffusion facilitator CzcD-associated flavoprotein CzcO